MASPKTRKPNHFVLFPYNENLTRALNITSLKCCLASTDAIDRWEKIHVCLWRFKIATWNPPGFHKRNKVGCFSNRVVYMYRENTDKKKLALTIEQWRNLQVVNFIYMCVCIYIYIHIYIYTYTYIHTYIHIKDLSFRSWFNQTFFYWNINNRAQKIALIIIFHSVKYIICY